MIARLFERIVEFLGGLLAWGWIIITSLTFRFTQAHYRRIDAQRARPTPKEREDPPFDYYYTCEYLNAIGEETYRNVEVQETANNVSFHTTLSCLGRLMLDDPQERQFYIDRGYTDEQGF